MSWLFSQALVEEYLGDICSDGEQSVPLSGNNTQQAYCAPDKMTAFSRLSRFGMTYKPLTEDRKEELLTLFREDFHAKTSQQQEKAQELMENDQECGDKWLASFTRYDQSTSLWKTHQCSLLGDLDEFLETWPQWGLMRDGECWEQVTLERHIREIEFGLSQKKWPTPVCQDSRHAISRHLDSTNQHWKSNLGEVVMSLEPTTDGRLNPTWVEWLMGWPLEWTDLKPLAMDKFLEWQQLHGIYSQNDV